MGWNGVESARLARPARPLATRGRGIRDRLRFECRLGSCGLLR